MWYCPEKQYSAYGTCVCAGILPFSIAYPEASHANPGSIGGSSVTKRNSAGAANRIAIPVNTLK